MVILRLTGSGGQIRILSKDYDIEGRVLFLDVPQPIMELLDEARIPGGVALMQYTQNGRRWDAYAIPRYVGETLEQNGFQFEKLGRFHEEKKPPKLPHNAVA